VKKGLYNRLMLHRLLVTEIHAWGGLGSQLFAVAATLELKNQFPHKRVVVVLHTGGVTRRSAEVVELFPNLSFRFLDDFGNVAETDAFSRSSQKLFLRKSLVKMLEFFRLVIPANNDKEFSKVKPWTLQLRGHYSDRTIPEGFLSLLDQILTQQSSEFDFSSQEFCCIHYRLGDLLSITNKSPISVEEIVEEYFKRFQIESQLPPILLFSDSPDEAKARFLSLKSFELLNPDSDSRSVIVNACQSKYFIGTSSKISFWIAALRASIYGSPSSLPRVNIPQYSALLGSNLKKINPY
jgi:hypothetical protein